jgi:hypothetical protein
MRYTHDDLARFLTPHVGRHGLSRRTFLKAGAATTALIATTGVMSDRSAAKSGTPSPVPANPAFGRLHVYGVDPAMEPSAITDVHGHVGGSAAYIVPTPAVPVATSADLLAALAAPTAQNIVLTALLYDNGAAFVNASGHRLYSAAVGSAMLKAGLVLGGNYGPGGGLVQGVAFDVSDPAKIASGGTVSTWGPGAVKAQVLDCTFEGHGVIIAAIVMRQPEGAQVSRVHVRNFTDYGVLLDANDPALVPTVVPILEDLDVAYVSRAVPGSANGTAEMGVWVGNKCIVRRIRVRRCWSTGLWTGTANQDSVHEDLDIDEIGNLGVSTGACIGLEHWTRRSTFRRATLGSQAYIGVLCEWNYGRNDPASIDNVIGDSTIRCARAGVYMDEGTTRTTVRRVTFIGQTWAAIGDFKGVGNVYDNQGNDYSGIAAGAVPVSLNHV